MGFVEEKARNLSGHKKSSIAALIVCAVILFLIGGLIAAVIIAVAAEDGKVYTAGVVVALLFIVGGIASITVAIRRTRKRRENQNNPYAYVKVYGSDVAAANVAADFNLEAGNGILHEVKSLAWFTEHYLLTQDGLEVGICDLSSVIWVSYQKNVAAFENRRSVTYHHTLFFRSGSNGKPRPLSLVEENQGRSEQIGEILKSYGLPVEENAAMHKMAIGDYGCFELECSKRTSG